MKTVTRLLILTLIISLGTVNQSYAKKKKFKGTIKYEIKYEGDIDPAQKNLMPTEYTVTVMGNKMKKESFAQGAYITEITDGDSKTMTIIVEGGGMKMYFTLTEEEIKNMRSEDDDEPVFSTSEETKTIKEYACKSVVVKSKNEYDEEVSVTMFYSESIGSKAMHFASPYLDIDGIPLETKTVTPELTTIETATEIKQGKIKDVDFMIPEDATELTDEQKKALLEGMKGGE
jgi:hypothetical protein